MAFAEDLTHFLDLAGFAVQAQAITRFGEVVEFPVIFDAAYTGAAGNVFEASRPQCIAASTQVQDLVQGCHIDIPETVPGTGFTAWQAAEIQPDGTGITIIILERRPS